MAHHSFGQQLWLCRQSHSGVGSFWSGHSVMVERLGSMFVDRCIGGLVTQLLLRFLKPHCRMRFRRSFGPSMILEYVSEAADQAVMAVFGGSPIGLDRI